MRALPLLLSVLLATGCAERETNQWKGTPAEGTFAVVFLPVDTAPIDAVWKDGSRKFAFDLANKVDFLGKDADGWSLATLPRSGTEPEVVPGAGWTVATRLLSLEIGPSPLGPQWLAKAEMRAFDKDKREVFRRTAHGTRSTEGSPKLMSPESKPEVQAAWTACANAAEALMDALRVRQDLPYQPPVAPAPAPVVTVQVTITSIPDHADVLVDGKFRGTTPLAVGLPTKPLLIRIERQGSQPWSRELTPEEGMQIAPALEPLAPPAAPAPVPAPAPVEAPAAEPAAVPAP